jgi:hypothetical protein
MVIVAVSPRRTTSRLGQNGVDDGSCWNWGGDFCCWRRDGDFGCWRSSFFDFVVTDEVNGSFIGIEVRGLDFSHCRSCNGGERSFTKRGAGLPLSEDHLQS